MRYHKMRLGERGERAKYQMEGGGKIGGLHTLVDLWLRSSIVSVWLTLGRLIGSDNNAAERHQSVIHMFTE
jgi:hypothetical protein